MYGFIGQLKLASSYGKSYLTDCANTKSMLRIIQSIPSKKAEPFKQWLAQLGQERIEEIENPELAQNRVKIGHLLLSTKITNSWVLSTFIKFSFLLSTKNNYGLDL